MPIVPPILLRARRRRHRTRGDGGHFPPPPPPALTLVGVDGVSVFAGQLQMNLIFDTTFENPIGDPSAAEPTKWTARYLGQKYVGVLLAPVVEDQLFLLMDPAGAEAGADVLSYANAPSDIFDALGRSLAAFAGFAI